MRIRTLIPANAKPGVSLIQVTNPKTGRPARILVPKSAVPGKMIELELPDDGLSSQTRDLSSRDSVERKPQKENGVVNGRAQRGSNPGSRSGTPPRNSLTSAPEQQTITNNGRTSEKTPSWSSQSHEQVPLLKKTSQNEGSGTGCCSCFSSLCGFVS
jgi:hypothetical protein